MILLLLTKQGRLCRCSSSGSCTGLDIMALLPLLLVVGVAPKQGARALSAAAGELLQPYLMMSLVTRLQSIGRSRPHTPKERK